MLYVDPPYLGITRASGGEKYAVELLNADDHRELADALHACRAAVVLSGFDSPEYAELFDGWHSHRFATTTNRGGVSTESVEVLWSNRPFRDQPSLWDAS